MLERILQASVRHRWIVLCATLLTAIVGITLLPRLPVDAVPDITNVQVQINTEAPGYSPLEVERRITFPVETALAGIPHLDYTRSLSRYGLSQVTVIFEDGTDIYFARQLLGERLREAAASLPEGIEPSMGPIATGLGEIFLWTVVADPEARRPDGEAWTPTDLRTIQDWIIRPQMRMVPGVTEVNSLGGFRKQFQVQPLPEALIAYGLTFDDVVRALARNNDNVGAGYIERAGEQLLVRVPGRLESLEDIAALTVAAPGGVPIRLESVATIAIGGELRTGAATRDGRETVLGTAFMLAGENSREVAHAAAQRLREIAPTLPKGVRAEAVYDRTVLVDATIGTVATNLTEGALLVVAVLFVFLGDLRAAAATALVIPLAMLLTASGMVATNLSANLMSLGALDFGLIVDGSIIIVENCMRRLVAAERERGRPLEHQERLEVIASGAVEVRRATMFGELIIMVVYLPVLTLSGIEGKMFFPMAITVVMALAAAMLLSLTFVPAAVAVLLRAPRPDHGQHGASLVQRAYAPLLRVAVNRPRLCLLPAVILFAASLVLASRMGTEFVPSLDEGDIAMHALRIPGTGLEQAIAMQHTLEEAIGELEEVDYVFSRIGTADIATDPMPPNVADTMVMLKPRDQWPDPHRSREDLVSALEQRVRHVPGNNYEFTQPIEMRFNELIAGVRADVAVKVFGDDLDILGELAERVEEAVQSVPGAADVKAEQLTGLPVLTVTVDREAVARYGLQVADVQDVVAVAIAGRAVGVVYEGDASFDLVVRLPEERRNDVHALARLPVPLPPAAAQAPEAATSERYVPLGALARLDLVTGPNQLSRENGKRRSVVTANVRGRDLGSFVADARARVEQSVRLPAGYWIQWGGRFEHLLSAAARLWLVVPTALALILGLLWISLGSLSRAALVFTGVPLAATGGIAALWFRGMPLSISAAVGFIALSGVAVLNGLVLVSFIEARRAAGAGLLEAITEGATARLRPVLMTATVAALGFVPMALAASRGAEVQRPIATVVIGGILSSTLLTLVVVPALYRLLERTDTT